MPLASALEDGRALSLFASQRVIWIASAEAVLPRGRAAAVAASDESGDAWDAGQLAAYPRGPAPGTGVVLASSRSGVAGAGKAKRKRGP